jgi:hypothetical protein
MSYKFECPEHGEFKPTMVLLSNPLQAHCPVCNKRFYELNPESSGLTEEEFLEEHPEFQNLFKQKDN